MKPCPVCKAPMSDKAEFCINGHKYNDMPSVDIKSGDDFFSHLKKIANKTRKDDK